MAIALASWNVAHLACISRDGIHFIQFAGQIRDNPRFYLVAQKSQPGYSTLILVVHTLVGPWISADPLSSWRWCGQMIAAVGYVACVPLIYLLTRRLFDSQTAQVAAFLTALWPQAAQLGGDVLSDMPHLALYLAAVLAGGAALCSRRTTTLALAGFLAAMAYLVRQEALAIPLALTLLLWWRWRDGAKAWRRRVVASAVLAAAFIAPQTPYIAVTGTIMHKKGWRDLLLHPASAPAGAAQAEGGMRRAEWAHDVGFEAVERGGDAPSRFDLPHVAGTPERWLVPLKLLEAWARSGRYVISTLALLALLWRRVPRAQHDWSACVVLLILLQTLAVERRVANFGEFSSRYSLILAAFSIPWAAAALSAVAALAAERLPVLCVDSPRRSRLFLGLTVLPAAVALAFFALQPVNAHDSLFRDAGNWLRAHTPSADVVLADTRAARVMYYADRPWLELPTWHPTLDAISRLDAGAGSPARWCAIATTDARDDASDRGLLRALLSCPRWPNASVEQVWRDGDRSVTLVRLRS